METIKQRLGHSNHNHTYVYLYTHKGTASFSTATEFFGTSHADDLLCLFPLRKSAFYFTITTEQDRQLVKHMSLMWTNFARTGLIITMTQSLNTFFYKSLFAEILRPIRLQRGHSQTNFLWITCKLATKMENSTIKFCSGG